VVGEPSRVRSEKRLRPFCGHSEHDASALYSPRGRCSWDAYPGCREGVNRPSGLCSCDPLPRLPHLPARLRQRLVPCTPAAVLRVLACACGAPACHASARARRGLRVSWGGGRGGQLGRSVAASAEVRASGKMRLQPLLGSHAEVDEEAPVPSPVLVDHPPSIAAHPWRCLYHNDDASTRRYMHDGRRGMAGGWLGILCRWSGAKH
jgi:hypothetical protein